MRARSEQLAFSTLMLVLTGLCFYAPSPAFSATPSFLKFGCAAASFLLSAVACSPGSDLSLMMGGAGFTALIAARFFGAGVSLARPGAGLELLCLAAGAWLTVGAALAPPKKAVPTSKSSL